MDCNKKRCEHMKHYSSKIGILVCLSAALSVLSLGVSSAQHIVSKDQMEQSLHWKTAEEAIPVLKAQIDTWHAKLPGLQTGTPEHTNAMRHATYFKAIAQDMLRGKEVSECLENALPWAASLGGTREATFTSKSDLRSLYEEAKGLLTK